jgi:hypothetical protein
MTVVPQRTGGSRTSEWWKNRRFAVWNITIPSIE